MGPELEFFLVLVEWRELRTLVRVAIAPLSFLSRQSKDSQLRDESEQTKCLTLERPCLTPLLHETSRGTRNEMPVVRSAKVEITENQ